MKKNLLFLLVLIAGAFNSLEARGGRGGFHGGGRGRGGFHGGGRGHGHYHGGGNRYRNWNRWGGRGYYGRGWYPGWGWGGFATGLALGAASSNSNCGYDSWGNYVCSYY